MSITVKRILITLTSVIIIAYLIVQISISEGGRLKTEIAVPMHEYEYVVSEAYIIRNEQYVISEYKTGLFYQIDNAQRVAKNGVIAELYENESTAEKIQKIKTLEHNYEILKKAEEQNINHAPNLQNINNQIKDSIQALLNTAKTSHIGELSNAADNLLEVLNSKDIATGKTDNYKSTLENIKKEIEALKTSLPTPKSSVTAQKAGYFSFETDEYEAEILYDDALSVTYDMIANVKKGQVDSKAIGKIVTSYEWYMACPIDTQKARLFEKDTKVSVKIPSSISDRIEFTVAGVNYDRAKDKAVLILSCNLIDKDLIGLRNPTVNIITNEYEGLQVSKKAIRTLEQNGESHVGVYVRRGSTMVFKRINQIYAESAYALCEIKSENDWLSQFDEVIIEGRDLYDNKYIG